MEIKVEFIDVTISGGTANLAFAWSNGATTEDLSGLSGGAYTVSITDDSCTYEETYTVEELFGFGTDGFRHY
ncbi:MAG: hypothetical protein R2784_01070 [Saprospiraceae bacterium]